MIIRKSLLFISFLFFCKIVSGQQANIKALRLEENRQKQDTNEVKWHYELSKAYRRLNNDSSIYAAKKGILLARKINFKKGEGLCYSSLAVGYAIKGMFKEAVENCKKAIAINKMANPNQVAVNYSQMGLMIYSQGKIHNAIHYQNLALKFAERYNDKKVQCQAHNNIGIIYVSTGEYLRANDHFYKTLEFSEQLKDTMVIATACINISEIYQEQKDYKRALEFTNRALLLNKNQKDAVLTIVAYITIGTIYSKLGDQYQAITHFDKALKSAKEAGVESRLAECYINLGTAYLALENYDKALNYLLQAEALDKSENDKAALSGDYIILSNIYEKISKPELQVKYALMALKLAQTENLKPKIRDAAESIYIYYKKKGNANQSLYYLELILSTKTVCLMLIT
jgi:tetratricopeptide (TPR) repeat protein